MIEFTKDLIRRAWLVEDLNGESALVKVDYRNNDGTVENTIAGIRRNDKLPNGKYDWFEIRIVHPCMVDGEKAYYSDTVEAFAGSVFNLGEGGVYKSKDDYGTGIATIIDKNAKFYTSHMLQKTKFREISKIVKSDPNFSGQSNPIQRARIDELRQEIRERTFSEFMKMKRKNRIRKQKSWDKEMSSVIPSWIPEYRDNR